MRRTVRSQMMWVVHLVPREEDLLPKRTEEMKQPGGRKRARPQLRCVRKAEKVDEWREKGCQ